jgi:hypothetical protein
MISNPLARVLTLIVITGAMTCGVSNLSAVTMTYAGAHANMVNLYPGGGPANQQSYVVVPWRSEILEKPLDADGNDVFGSAGFALFATTFSYPDANAICCDAFINPAEEDPLFPNIINLPTWVTGSQILAERMAGGYSYALIDDPVLTNGYRDYNWGDTQSPPANPEHSQAPYVKMGFLDGLDINDNNPINTPAGRWGFTVGADVPSSFRLGVMTDGGDNGNFAPGELFIQQFVDTTPVGEPLGSGPLTGAYRDRMVDMHFFDITGAQEGDQFVIGVMSGAGSFGNSGVAGFSFDVFPDTGDNADFNSDGVVDGQDFLVWQRGGSPNSLSASDLALWQSQYVSGSLAAVSVPEPASWVLSLLALVGIRRARR